MFKSLRRLFAAWPDDWAFTAFICFVGLLPRLYVGLAWSAEPVWDGHYYHFGAERIAQGLGYSEDVVVAGRVLWSPWCHYPVGYSGLLAGAYRVFGSGLWVAPLVNVIIGTILIATVHRVARRFLACPRARSAAVLCALHPGLILYSALVMTELLAALVLLAAAGVALGVNPKRRAAVVAGGILGLGALVRPPSLLALPLLLCLFGEGWRRRVLHAGLAGLVALAVIAPWSYRNCRVMDGCALISTNGGWNLAIGALTETGRFVTLTAKDGCPVVTGQVQQDRCWANVGWDRIKRDPMAWIAKMPNKLRHTYNHETFPIEYLREAQPAAWPEARRQAGHAILTLFHHLLMLAAALSVIARPWPPRRSAAWLTQFALLLAGVGVAIYAATDPVHPFYWFAVLAPAIGLLPLPGAPERKPALTYAYGLVLATTLTHAVFFGDDRYHIVVSPVLCVLAAAALRPPRVSAADGPTDGRQSEPMAV